MYTHPLFQYYCSDRSYWCRGRVHAAHGTGPIYRAPRIDHVDDAPTIVMLTSLQFAQRDVDGHLLSASIDMYSNSIAGVFI
jgi:hypothetical protein